MKRIVTGVDPSGRSCVVEESELGSPGARIDPIFVFATDTVPPRPRPAGRGEDLDLGVAPGHTRWLVVQWPAGATSQMHHTDTIDYDVVLAGSMDLLLDDGEHHLEQGDCLVITGVDHNWRAGPHGCTLGVMLIGSTPRVG
jgi:hypothetical protein